LNWRAEARAENATMAEPFLGEIEAFSFSFAPKGWALCAGQLLPINQNQALFALLGTTFGGNGTTTFALPDLRGRIANASGQGPSLGNYDLGQTGGEESHTLALTEMQPSGHSHTVTAKNNGATGGTNVPSNAVTLGSGYASEPNSPVVNIYGWAAPTVAMGSLGPAGGQPHENRMPFLGLNYCIALQGIFPSRD
jgi:microcystin-dependent protein